MRSLKLVTQLHELDGQLYADVTSTQSLVDRSEAL